MPEHLSMMHAGTFEWEKEGGMRGLQGTYLSKWKSFEKAIIGELVEALKEGLNESRRRSGGGGGAAFASSSHCQVSIIVLNYMMLWNQRVMTTIYNSSRFSTRQAHVYPTTQEKQSYKKYGPRSSFRDALSNGVLCAFSMYKYKYIY